MQLENYVSKYKVEENHLKDLKELIQNERYKESVINNIRKKDFAVDSNIEAGDFFR